MKAHGRKAKAKLHKQHEAHAEHNKQAHDQHQEQLQQAHQSQDVQQDQQYQSAVGSSRGTEAIQQNLPQAVGARRSDRPGGSKKR